MVNILRVIRKPENWTRAGGMGMRKKKAIILFIIALALVGIGLASGEYWAVLEKARKVCLECVGIG
jgi:hypothetical protein